MYRTLAVILIIVAGFFSEIRAQHQIFLRAEGGTLFTQAMTRKTPPEYSDWSKDKVSPVRSVGGSGARLSIIFSDSAARIRNPELKNPRRIISLRAGFSNVYTHGSFSGIRRTSTSKKYHSNSIFVVDEYYLSAGASIGFGFGSKRKFIVESGIDYFRRVSGTATLYSSIDEYSIVYIPPSGAHPSSMGEVFTGHKTGMSKIKAKQSNVILFAALKGEIYSHKNFSTGLSAEFFAVCGRFAEYYGIGYRSQLIGIWLQQRLPGKTK